MRKPYLKKYKIINGYAVYIVDGKYIRDKINEEFTNYGTNSRFSFIPKKEIWIDREYDKDNETGYYLKNIFADEKLLAKGMGYDHALDISDKAEKRERRKKEKILKTCNKKEIFKKLHCKLLKKYSKKLKVWVVDGRLVRDCFFIEFTEGGHGYIYKFIPKDEVWVERDLRESEWGFVILHELHERNLMRKGMGYTRAHCSASMIEHHCRKNPKLLQKKIQEELAKVKG